MFLQPSASGELPWLLSASTAVQTTATATPTSGSGDDGGGDNGDSPGDTLQNWSSLIGIVTAIIGNILIALALNVQRYAHTRLHKQHVSNRRRAREAMKRAQSSTQHSSYGTVSHDEGRNGNNDGNGATISDDDGDDSRETDPLTASFLSSASTARDTEEEVEQDGKAVTTYLKSPYWWLGQILITLGEMGNFLAYGFAPASIVSPLGVVALISNCIIAPLMFHERFRQRDFWGVVIAVAGVVTVVLSAKTEENKLNPHDVWGAITTLAFEVYLTVTVLLIILLMWASPRYGKRTILIDLGLVGLFGGYTALSTKGVSSMLSSTLWRAFTTPVTYVLVVILLGTAIMQIRYVNKALQRFDSTQVIPIQFVMFTLCVILGSAVLYRDFEKTTAKQAGKFVGGCLLTFFGVFLITSGREHHDDDDDVLSEAQGVEETIGLSHQDGGQQVATGHRSRETSVPQSRRSSKHSRVGFVEATRPHSPNDDDDDEPTTPTFRVTGPGSTPSSLGPESASLLGNPWHDSSEPPTPPGRGIRTMSADTVMRGSAVLSPSRSYPVTPMRDGNIPPGYPADSSSSNHSRANTFSAQHHRSGTFISPSPLASTVTTVMKDGFLRGDKKSIPHMSSMRHIRSKIRASLFFNDDDGQGASGRQGIPAPEGNLSRSVQDDEYPDGVIGESEDARRMRSRSLSDALGDLFKPKKKRRKDEVNTDVEHGNGPDNQPGPSR